MKGYLTEFFNEFEYEQADAEHLLLTYDKIAENEEASRILAEALSAYEANIELNYDEEILKRSKAIARLTLVHPYTTDLLIFICMTKRLKELYLEKGLDLRIYKDTILDLKWKLEECKILKGICGSFVAPWFVKFFMLKRVALGRLQFELATISVDYEKNGVKLEKGESTVINLHIPRTGTPIDKESCDDAYARAREFFKDDVGENCAFICKSWLLFPENASIIPPNTNTYRFFSEFDIVDWDFNEGEDLWRLFDTHEMNPDRLPANSSLRRAYIEHLKNGGRVGWGLGIRI